MTFKEKILISFGWEAKVLIRMFKICATFLIFILLIKIINPLNNATLKTNVKTL